MSKKQRLSNIELLRNISMLLVMVFHITHALSLSKNVSCNNDLASIINSIAGSISIICVNVFILISGYFGIKFSIKGIFKLVFQVAFLSLFVYAIFCLLGLANFSLIRIWHCTFGMFSMYWFVWAYLLLYIISPILNAFVEQAQKKDFGLFLLMYYLFTLYVYLTLKVDPVFSKGFHTISFIGLYLLARYVYINKPRWSKLPWSTDIMIYLVCVCLTIILKYFMNIIGVGGDFISEKMGNYASPTTIIGSLFFFLAFTKFKFHSRFINWCAISCFAAYILHQQFDAKFYYNVLFQHLYNIVPLSLFWPSAILVVLVIFMICILIDKIRIVVYNELLKIFSRKLVPMREPGNSNNYSNN
jgi:surface polysaccharide O-acyltransferase-like enzyme